MILYSTRGKSLKNSVRDYFDFVDDFVDFSEKVYVIFSCDLHLGKNSKVVGVEKKEKQFDHDSRLDEM